MCKSQDNHCADLKTIMSLSYKLPLHYKVVHTEFLLSPDNKLDRRAYSELIIVQYASVSL